MKEKLLQNLGTLVSFRSLHVTDTNFYKGILTSLTTYEFAKATRNDIDNYHRVIKKGLHTLPSIKDLTWFVITGEDKKQNTFAYEWCADFQYLNSSSISIDIGRVGEADKNRIETLLRNAGYTSLDIKMK